MLFALVSTPPNFLWQQTLEAWYPSHVPGEKGDKKLSGKNTLAKFAVDQALGGPVNTVLFLSAMAWMRGTEVAPFVVKVRTWVLVILVEC